MRCTQGRGGESSMRYENVALIVCWSGNRSRFGLEGGEEGWGVGWGRSEFKIKDFGIV